MNMNKTNFVIEKNKQDPYTVMRVIESETAKTSDHE